MEISSILLHGVTIWDVWMNLIMFVTPVMAGVLLGWAWKPSWVDIAKKFVDPFFATGFYSILVYPLKNSSSNSETLVQQSPLDSPYKPKDNQAIVDEEDFRNLCLLVEEKDGGPPWIKMMDKSAVNMEYQAWRRDPNSGPTQYRTRTVFENMTPEMVRDFFWDDPFRRNWDDMLIHSSILDENPLIGTLVVHWIRKFPLFCSDREYIVGRRIWDVGGSYYCVTKSVPWDLPRQSKPRRVDIFYSSWCIRELESRRSSCEVVLFHYEDMGIPSEIAKLGVRQGMWGAVKKIDPGLRLYQKEREDGVPLSACALMAQINTKVSYGYLKCIEKCGGDEIVDLEVKPVEKKGGANLPKILILCGAVVLACTFDGGLLTRAAMFGVMRRFANRSGKL